MRLADEIVAAAITLIDETDDPAAYPEVPVRCLGPRPKPLAVKLLNRGELSAPGAAATAGLPAHA